MSHSLLSAEAIYSPLGADPELAELVEMFVEEMPERIAILEESLEIWNREQLGTTAHQLKGASGSYGFHQITDFAARLEKSVRDKEPDAEIEAALKELVTICQKIRAGAPQ